MTRLQVFTAAFVTAAAIAFGCSDDVLGPDRPAATEQLPVPSEKREQVRLMPLVVEEQWTRALPRDSAMPGGQVERRQTVQR
jgi:hypothetical protein